MEHSEHQMYPNYFTSAPVEPTVAFSGTPTDQYDESVKEGGIAQITTTAIHGHDSRVASSTDVANPEPRAWTTSFFRLGPLSGIFCILVAMGSIIAALGILVGSRGAAVTTWTIPPSTYLAMFTAVANQSLRFAAFQGLAIAWWFRATKGETLAQLHHRWRAGITASGAVISGRKMGMVGLACLCSTLVAIDGPLLQKSTTIKFVPIAATPIILNITMARELSQHTGGWFKTEDLYRRMWPSFNETIPTVNGSASNLIQTLSVLNDKASVEWFQTKSIVDVVHGCPETNTCQTSVVAPALAATSCTSHQIPVDYWRHLDPDTLRNAYEYTKIAPPLDTTAFIVDIALLVDVDEIERINMISGYSVTHNGTGTFNYTVCTLDAAIGEYNVRVTDDGLTLAPSLPRIIALSNPKVSHEWNGNQKWYPSTLGGIVSTGLNKWLSAQLYYYDGGSAPTLGGYLPYVSLGYQDVNSDFWNEPCWSYRDPHKDMLWDLNKLMFMLGANFGSGQQVNGQTTNPIIQKTAMGYIQGSHNVFATNLHWFGAAAVVELVCVALILPTYFGWWKLGRSVSFSPLEIAKAFEAPLLSDYNSNSSGRDIAKAVGDVRTQYGETSIIAVGQSAGRNPKKLAFANPAFVSFPRSDTCFDN